MRPVDLPALKAAPGEVSGFRAVPQEPLEPAGRRFADDAWSRQTTLCFGFADGHHGPGRAIANTLRAIAGTGCRPPEGVRHPVVTAPCHSLWDQPSPWGPVAAHGGPPAACPRRSRPTHGTARGPGRPQLFTRGVLLAPPPARPPSASDSTPTAQQPQARRTEPPSPSPNSLTRPRHYCGGRRFPPARRS